MNSSEERFCLSAGEYIQGGDRVMVCVSGGADSMALLYLMKKICAQKGADIFVCHFNHKFRGADSMRDARFVKKTAEKEGIEFIYGEIKTKKKDKSENAARNARYSFFLKECLKRKINKIAVGHTLTDNAETVFFRFMKGSGKKGLSGIPPKRKPENGEFGIKDTGNIEIIRPLINLKREELIKWLAEMKISFCTDETNFSDVYERNVIRNRIMPVVKNKINRGIEKTLDSFARLSAMDEDFFKARMDGNFRKIVRHGKNGLRIDAKRLLALHPAEAFRLLKEAVEQGTGGVRRVDFNCVNEAYKGIETGKGSNLPHGMVCRVNNGYAEIRGASAENRTGFRTKTVQIPGSADAGGRIYKFDIIKNKKNIKLKDKKTAHMDREKIKEPISIRSGKPGDVFVPYGMDREVKLKDFLNSAKAAENAHVVCDKTGIIWIPGVRAAERVKVTKDTENIIRIGYKDNGA
ncbi:MAG: tRNA lysidine(34) synthetase TilS [Candidatus Goldiibacteriota bacterium]